MLPVVCGPRLCPGLCGCGFPLWAGGGEAREDRVVVARVRGAVCPVAEDIVGDYS